MPISENNCVKLGSKTITDTLRGWLTLHRQQVTDGTVIARAIDHSLGGWAAPVRCIDEGDLPIDNNNIENRIRPTALLRSNGCSRARAEAASALPLR